MTLEQIKTQRPKLYEFIMLIKPHFGGGTARIK